MRVTTTTTTTSGGCAPITIEELVSSPRILPHQHHNKLPPQASFPLKASSSTASNELKVMILSQLFISQCDND